jgi:hypothetical protein
MNYCEFTDGLCKGCGWTLPDGWPVNVRRKCPNAIPAGDALEELLTSYGITQEWWTEYKSQHGLPPTCGCDSRREYLNNLSKAHPNLAKYGVMVFRALTRKKP